MATRGLDSQIGGGGGGGGGKIEGRYILIIAMSEHHVDNMNRKVVTPLLCMGDLFTDVYIR